MSDTRVLVLVGSLRADSYNRRLAEAVREQAPVGVTIDIAEGLAEIPFYNEDIDGDATPAGARSLREQVASADRILVITPEYNGTTPALINNVIDWASRPYGDGAIKDKPLAVVGTSVGQHGGQWAHEDTRKSARVAGALVVEDISVSHAYGWGQDPVADEQVVQQFVNAVAKLAAHEAVA